MRKTIAEHMIDVLRETDNPAVMYGDCGLLDTCAKRAGIKFDWPPTRRWKKVLAGLERSKLFVKSVVHGRWGVSGNPYVRKFTPANRSVSNAK